MPPASRACAKLGAGSSSVSRKSNNSGETLTWLAVAHSSNSARWKRYWPATCRAGRLRCLIQRVTVASETPRNLPTSLTVSCTALLLLFFHLHVLEQFERLIQVGLEILFHQVEHFAQDS